VDLFQLARVLLRRFYIFVPIVLVAFVLGTQASGRIDPEYTSSGAAVLQGSSVGIDDSGKTIPVNPVTNYSSSLATLGQVLALSVESGTGRGRIAAEGLSVRYDVAPDNRSPLMRVTATSSDPEVAQATVNRVLELMSEDLAARQSGAPQHSLVELVVLAEPYLPGVDESSAGRVRLMFVGAGVIGATAACVVFDALWRMRRGDGRRRTGWPARGARGDDAGAPGGDPVDGAVARRRRGREAERPTDTDAVGSYAGLAGGRGRAR
jgi:uncharacterized protein involved in exopolysaccharide biosynthesis